MNHELTERDANHMGAAHAVNGASYKNPFEINSPLFNAYERGYKQASLLYRGDGWGGRKGQELTYRQRALLRQPSEPAPAQVVKQKSEYKSAKDGD